MFFIALKYVLFWVVHPCLQALIAGTMFRRKLYREYPLFLTYTVSHLVRFAVLFWIHHQGNREAYRYAYMGAEALDAALAFGAIYELYGHLFHTYDGVQKLAGIVFRGAAVLLLALAVLTTFTSPTTDSSRVLAGLFTLERGVNVVRGGLLLLLFLFSSYLGLRWKHFAFGIAAGFALESSVELVTFALRTHLGLLGSPVLSLISSAAYNCSVVIWLAYLLSPEPATPLAQLPAKSELEGWNQALLELLNR
jgi:hypothetical protein